jgi:hypothetical protein
MSVAGVCEAKRLGGASGANAERSSVSHGWRPDVPTRFVLCVWLGLTAWRPLVLGFYGDDWWSIALPVQQLSLLSMIEADRARAPSLLLYWALRHGLAGSAAGWQAFAAGVNLSCALMIVAVVSRVGGSSGFLDRWSGAAAACLWLAAPWSLPYTAWPVMAVPLLTVAVLASSAALLLSRRCATSTAGAAAAVPYLLGCLIYEAIWGAFVPVVLSLALVRLRARAPLRPVLAYAIAAGVGQVLLFILNRLLSTGSMAKQISSVAVELALYSFQIAPFQIAEAIGALSPVALAATAVLAGAFIGVSFINRDVVPASIVAASLLGIAIVIVVHAAAGYGTRFVDDLIGRTAMVPTFWLAIGFGAVARGAFADGRILRLCGTMAVAAILTVLAISLLGRTREWAKGWTQERAVLKTFPASEAQKLAPRTFIVADIPRGGSLRGQFATFWDIAGGLVTAHPELAHIFLLNGESRVTVLRTQDWFTEWDGSKLSQGWCPDHLLWSYAASAVVVWDQRAGTLTPIAPGTRLGCGTADRQ